MEPGLNRAALFVVSGRLLLRTPDVFVITRRGRSDYRHVNRPGTLRRTRFAHALHVGVLLKPIGTTASFVACLLSSAHALRVSSFVKPLGATVPLLACVLSAAEARAEVEPPVEYAAAPGCPSRDEFISAVAARRSSDREPAEVPLFRVVITKTDGYFAGELRVSAKEGESAPRRVTDPDCAKVVEGLAVVAAIVLAGEDSTASAERSADESVEGPTTPAPTVPATAREGVLAAEPADPPLVGSTFNQPDRLRVPAGTLRFRGKSSYMVFGGADFGTIPGLVVPRYDLVASRATFMQTPSGSTHLWSPILQVRWAFLGPVDHRSPDGYQTSLWGLHAGVSSCSAFTYDSRAFRVLACADFTAEFANLKTRSPDGTLLSDQETGAGSATLSLDARYSLTDWLEIGLRGGPRIRFGSYAAERPDGSKLFESGPFGGQVSLGLGFLF